MLQRQGGIRLTASSEDKIKSPRPTNRRLKRSCRQDAPYPKLVFDLEDLRHETIKVGEALSRILKLFSLSDSSAE